MNGGPAVMETSSLCAEDLGKRYRKTWALRECTFDVPSGRVAALVGPNGAGKTTLLDLMAGVLEPDTGSVRVGPAPTGAATPSARVAYLAQDRPLYSTFTAADMLDFGRRFNRRWDQARAFDWLDTFDVPLRRRCDRLSGGQRTQVALALALGASPDLLLLDEPLANLDPIVRVEVARRLLDLVAEQGTTIVLSTHVVAELPGRVDYLVVLVEGRLVLAGDIDDLLAAHAYLEGPRSNDAPGPWVTVRASHSERRSRFLVEHSGDGPPPLTHPTWQATPVGLEDLIMDYLQAANDRPADLAGVDHRG